MTDWMNWLTPGDTATGSIEVNDPIMQVVTTIIFSDTMSECQTENQLAENQLARGGDAPHILRASF